MTPYAKTPTISSRPETAFRVPPLPPKVPELNLRPLSTLTEALSRLNSKEVALWTPRQVARWMYDAGFEPSIVEKFEENDISGEILITLKFEDLRELDIQSFGQRHKLWNEIHNLREDVNARPPSPTVIECDSSDDENVRRKPRRKHKKPSFEDIISPLESVSIVGIEQLMPKPHQCAKGEKCSKWRKQQRIIAEFNKEHPAGQPFNGHLFNGHPVSPKGGRILLAGDPGNPFTAEAARPFSDAQPSVVASSDVLGPGPMPSFANLEEASLRALQTRDPQDNVRQFLTFQHIDPTWGTEEPATPPYEMFPTLPATPANPLPNQNLRLNLPKLAIPSQQAQQQANRIVPPPRSASANGYTSSTAIAQLGPMHRAEALSPDLRNGPAQAPFMRSYQNSLNQVSYQQQLQQHQPARFGTPASEMDIPIAVTAQNLGPISRDASQSVPPNMNYRQQVPLAQSQPIARSLSRSSRRPSYLPRLDENLAAGVVPPRPSFSSVNSASTNTSNLFSAGSRSPVKGPSTRGADNETTHSGWMKKRKTKLLRHEWNDVHATLSGTKLAMAKDSSASAKVVEELDVEAYSVACTSGASGSKLNAAFKAMSLSSGKKDDVTAFAFQLVPEPKKNADGSPQRKTKRESLIGTAGTAGKGPEMKTHHFAVTGREERIDWMRELMLAKALGKRGQGFEVEVNGNMI